jgi:hypothetical protein
LGYGRADSPVAFAAFMHDYDGGEAQGLLTRDEVLDNVTLYWLTHSMVSAARIYWETSYRSNTSATVQKTAEISLPVAVSVFPGEIYHTPRSWTQRAYRTSSISTRSTRATTSPRGVSPSSLRPNCVPHSDHSGRRSDHHSRQRSSR